MAKAAGISSFVFVLLLILGAVIGGTISGIFNLIALALFVFIMVGLNVNLRQHGYTGAGGLIWTILGLLVAIVVAASTIARSGAPGASAGDPMAIAGALGIWGIVIGLVFLGVLICYLLLGAKLKDYGNMGGGGLWKGIGIVLIIAAALMLIGVVFAILTAVTKVGGLGFVAGAAYIIGALVFLAYWIMLGIGLLQDSGRPATGRA